VDLSVIIATWMRPQYVLRTVADVWSQAWPGIEVIVVDQSDDLTHARIRRGLDDRTTLIHAPPGLQAARNRGLSQAQAPFVLYLDDDVRLLSGALAAHLAALDQPGVVGVAGRIIERDLVPNSRRVANRVGIDGRVRTNLDGGLAQAVESQKGANMSFRSDALRAAGGFDPSFGGTAFLEDTDASQRIRRLGQIRYAPRAAVVHLSAPSGGVRPARPEDGLLSRFRNTGRFLAAHHPVRVLPAAGAFAAIALREGMRAGDPRLSARLVLALGAGFSERWLWRQRTR